MTGSRRVGPPASHILETDVDGDISLYDPKTESVTVLNGTASDVWLLCDGEHTVSEIIHLLALSYEIDESEIVADVERAIRDFTEAGLLEE